LNKFVHSNAHYGRGAEKILFPGNKKRRFLKILFNHGWTRMDTDKKGAGVTRIARINANKTKPHKIQSSVQE
jgi:hypothetical protein